VNQGKALLLDVLKLRYIYNDHDFESVIHLLNNKSQDPFLVSILELVKGMDESSPNSPASIHKKADPAASPADSWIEHISEGDAAKNDLLHEAQSLLNGRRVFPTVKDLREYLSQTIKFSGKKTKSELISLCLERFSQFSVQDLEIELARLKERPNETKKANSFLKMANKMMEAKR
jgi:hypothetical protein